MKIVQPGAAPLQPLGKVLAFGSRRGASSLIEALVAAAVSLTAAAAWWLVFLVVEVTP